MLQTLRSQHKQTFSDICPLNILFYEKQVRINERDTPSFTTSSSSHILSLLPHLTYLPVPTETLYSCHIVCSTSDFIFFHLKKSDINETYLSI